MTGSCWCREPEWHRSQDGRYGHCSAWPQWHWATWASTYTRGAQGPAWVSKWVLWLRWCWGYGGRGTWGEQGRAPGTGRGNGHPALTCPLCSFRNLPRAHSSQSQQETKVVHPKTVKDWDHRITESLSEWSHCKGFIEQKEMLTLKNPSLGRSTTITERMLRKHLLNPEDHYVPWVSVPVHGGEKLISLCIDDLYFISLCLWKVTYWVAEMPLKFGDG